MLRPSQRPALFFSGNGAVVVFSSNNRGGGGGGVNDWIHAWNNLLEIQFTFTFTSPNRQVGIFLYPPGWTGRVPSGAISFLGNNPAAMTASLFLKI